MTHNGEESPPAPDDVDGWREAIMKGKLGMYRPEALLCAVQDLGPNAPAAVMNPIAKHLSNIILHMARNCIGTNHANHGRDMIERVHGEIWDTMFDLDSDARLTMRNGLGGIVKFRCLDAIAEENKHSRIPLEPKVREIKKGEDPYTVANDHGKVRAISHLVAGQDVEPLSTDERFPGDDAIAAPFAAAPSLLDAVRHFESNIDVERILARIPDDRKRLAFRLFMEQVPNGSKEFFSISKAVGVSPKWVETWIKEIIELVQQTEEFKELANIKVKA